MRNFLYSKGQMNWLGVIRVVIWAIPVFVLVTLLNQHYFFSTTLSYRYRPGVTPRIIAPVNPVVIHHTADPKLPWIITTDALPFRVIVPRAIKDIRIQGQLQRGAQSVVWLRAQGAKDADMMTLVSSSFLDALEWKKVSNATTTLWMREKVETSETVTEGTGKNTKQITRTWTKDVPQYASVENFYSNPPDLGIVGSVGINRLALTNLTNVDLPSKGVTLGQVFRGGHSFYVYSKGGELKISFDKIDRNRKKDADTMTVRIARADQLTDREPTWLETLRIKDDGNTKAVGPQGKPHRVELSIPNTTAGAYFVEVLASEDILLANLASTSSMISFPGRIFLAEGPAYGDKSFRPVTLLTNGSVLTLMAVHDQGKQDVQIAGKKYSLKVAGEEEKSSALHGITSVEISRPDLKISSDGLIALVPAKIFPSAGTNPLDLTTSPNLDGIEYIIAQYRPNTKNNISFDETYHWSELELKGKQLSFALEAPGLEAAGVSIGLNQLTTTMTRGPFPWGKVWKKVNTLF